jgi:parallel beta-helix repeat protein
VDDDNTAGPWDGTPEHPYRNITSGLEHALAGDTIFVYMGTYYENVIVNKMVSLIGEKRENTIVDAGGTGIVVSVTLNNVIINGFKIQNSGSEYPDSGIYVYQCSNVTIRNCNITNNHWGIFLLESSNNTIVGNHITTNYMYGIYLLFDSNNNNISGNSITNNYCGIFFPVEAPSNNTVIYHNNFVNNTNQAFAWGTLNSVWDDGYPSGGNYWSDQYHGDCADHFSGPGQNISGSDGIVDNPYVIDENNRDRYPLMEPWMPTPPTPVGGIYIPVDKLALLAPYIVLASAISTAIVATAIFFKHRKKPPFKHPEKVT